MKFLSDWITTSEFINLPIRNVFCKECSGQDHSPSSITNYHTHFRKKLTFANTENIYVNITADDYYKLYINGKFVCQGPAAAYPTDYKFNRINISSYLTKGENIIAVHVYYQGHINRVWVSGDNRMGLVADFFSGDNYLFGTDSSWKYSIAKQYGGDMVGYETAYLENIDFNLEEKGWKEFDFDDSSYFSAIEKKDIDYTFNNEPVPTVDVYSIKPKKIEKLAPGRYFVDFGGEIVGTFSMSAKGEKGQKVNILCGEELLDEEKLLVRHDMRCNCNYNETCTLSGKVDIFDFFDYKAFRYVNVFTDIDNLDPETFGATVSHHDFEQKTFLRTDIPNLNEIWDMCVRTIKFGAQESLYDCPTREKGTYLGDFAVMVPAQFYLTKNKQLYKKMLFDFAETARVCKGLMCVSVCGFMQEIADYSLLYPLHLLKYYELTKDIETTKTLYPTACGVIDYFKAFEREDGLLENVYEKWNMVDWPENVTDNYDAFIKRDTYGIDCHNVLNAYYIGALKTMNTLSEIVGTENKFEYESKEAAFEKAFFDAERNLYCDTEKKSNASLHSNIFPVFYDITKDESVRSNIKSFIIEKGFSCGVWIAYFVMKSLGKMGAYEEELKLLVNDSEFGWVNMLREGATTCFEAWGKDLKWNTSLCHPWACAPILILAEDLNGKFEIELTE